MVYPTGGELAIPCAEELRMLLRVFGWFVAHDMGDVIPEAEKQGGVCPLEEAVGDSDIRPCLADCFQEIGLDKKTDWEDVIHLNTNGAIKFSSFLAKLIQSEGIQPGDNVDTALWETRVADIMNRAS